MSQYKNDNILFKTIDPSDLCNQLQKNAGYLLLDVRTSGEHLDTSSFGLNVGRLKGARNIDVRELGRRIREIQPYKNKPVFVYCSHSQRSRRASKLLADSGFTKVFNINGGMTQIHYTDLAGTPCFQSLWTSTSTYSIISPMEVCRRLSRDDNHVFLLDVRSDSAFRHISLDDQINAMGSLKNAVNIPLDQLPGRVKSIPTDRDIIVLDVFGGDAGKAAKILALNGYQHALVLVEGIARWVSMGSAEVPCKMALYNSPVTYKLMSTLDFAQLTREPADYLLVDVRSKEEFTNRATETWKNIGHIKNATNLQSSVLLEGIAKLAPQKSKHIIVYDFSGSAESFLAARMLVGQGYENVTVLVNGLFDLRWTAANRQGYAYLADIVSDIPEQNL